MDTINNGFAALWIFASFIWLYVLLLAGLFWRARRKRTFAPFTEETLRLPAHSLREKEREERYDLFSCFFEYMFSAMGVVLAFWFLDGMAQRVTVAGLVLNLVRLTYNSIKYFHNIRKLVLGREAEEYTGQELNLLMTKGAFVFHDIPYKYGNIDHIVVGPGRVLVVETKGVRKPHTGNAESSRHATVRFDGQTLTFPHFSSSKAIEQADIHAKYLREAIRKQCGFGFPVIPVVALPGWYIEVDEGVKVDTLVINPRRAKVLSNWMGELRDKRKRDLVANFIASVARSASSSSRLSDPDASMHYDIWLNPRYKGRLLGE